MRKIIVAAVFAASALVASPADAAVNERGFDRVEFGMSKSQVREILDARGKKTGQGGAAVAIRGGRVLAGPYQDRQYVTGCGRGFIRFVRDARDPLTLRVGAVDYYFGGCK